MTKADGLMLLLVMVGAFGIFKRTLVPGLLSGDGGEFQTLTALWGHTHPTGYPVYLTLAKVFSFFVAGEPAYLVNLFSAAMGALTVGGIYVCGMGLGRDRTLAMIASLIFTITPTFWSQAIIAEVYTAAAAIFVWIIALLILTHAENAARNVFIVALLGGLSLGIHLSVALLAPAVLLFMFSNQEIGLKKGWQPALKGAGVGILITVSLFWLIDTQNPSANYFNAVITPSRSAWGLEADMIDGSFERLMFGWRATQFRSFMFAEPLRVMPQQAADYFGRLTQELALPLLVFSAIGAVGLFFKRRSIAILLLSGLLIQWLYFFNYEIWDLYVFFIPSYLLLMLLALAGMGVVNDWVKGLGRARILHSFSFLIAILLLYAAFQPTLQPRQEAMNAGERLTFDFDEYPEYNPHLEATAAAIVAELPENGIVFTDWDQMWPLFYAAQVKSNRDDLLFIETFPADDEDGVADSLVEYVEKVSAEHPVFFVEWPQKLSDAGFQKAPVRIGPQKLFRVVTGDPSP